MTTLSFSTSSETCEVRTLAHYKREKPEPKACGSLVAANDKFTCYAIRNGLIRAIHRESEVTSLLRGLTKDVSDICFCGDLVAAVAVDGATFVWSLELSGDSISATPLVSYTPDQPIGTCLCAFVGPNTLCTTISNYYYCKYY